MMHKAQNLPKGALRDKGMLREKYCLGPWRPTKLSPAIPCHAPGRQGQIKSDVPCFALSKDTVPFYHRDSEQGKPAWRC